MTISPKERKAYGFPTPLQKLNPAPIIAQRAPKTSDISYRIGQVWIDKSNDDSYILTSVSSGNANWQPTSSNTAGSAPISKYVVAKDGSAGYTTIQSALDAANAAGGGIVYVRPGFYVENLTCYDDTQVVGTTAYPEFTTRIQGIHVPPTGLHEFTFANLYLSSSTHIFNSTAAGAGTLTIKNCKIDVGNGYTYNLPNWTNTLQIIDSDSIPSVHNGCVNNTGGCVVRLIGSRCGDGTSNAMNISGPFEIRECEIRPPIILRANAGSTFRNITNTKFLEDLTIIDTAQAHLMDCYFDVGNNYAITNNSTGLLTISETTIDSTVVGDALQGTGTIDLGSITFINNSNIAGTLTINNSSRFASSGLKIVEGTNAVMGIATLVAGIVIVNTTKVTANSRIFLTHQNNSGTPGFVSVIARVVGTSFTITSSNAADTSNIAWQIIEPM